MRLDKEEEKKEEEEENEEEEEEEKEEEEPYPDFNPLVCNGLCCTLDWSLKSYSVNAASSITRSQCPSSSRLVVEENRPDKSLAIFNFTSDLVAFVLCCCVFWVLEFE
jgi:hypothetical protein